LFLVLLFPKEVQPFFLLAGPETSYINAALSEGGLLPYAAACGFLLVLETENAVAIGRVVGIAIALGIGRFVPPVGGFEMLACGSCRTF